MPERALRVPISGSPRSRSDTTSATRTSWALYGFALWLALLPLPLGSNRTWALALSLPLLMLLAFVVAWQRGEQVHRSLPATLASWPGVCLALFLAVIALQLVPFGETAISIAPQRTALFLLVALGCALAFWLPIALVRTESDLKVLLYALVACGALQAMLAVGIVATRTTIAILDSELTPDQITGTFANRNNLAAYLNICLAAGVGILMGQLAEVRGERTWRQRLRDWVSLVLSGKARLRLVLVLMVIALILTRSRMGNASFFFGLLAAASIYAVYARARRRGLMLFVASIIVIDVVLIGAWVGLDKVVERFQETSLLRPELPASVEVGPPPPTPVEGNSVEQRVDPAFDALRSVRQHPLLGTGGGTFFLAFMAITPADIGFIMHAHNDYLEIASDTGLVGLAALLLLALAAIWESIRILRERRSEVARAAAFATLMALACLGLHSFVDFNLQMPAVAMTLSTVVALPFAARSFSSRRKPRRSATRAGLLGPFLASATTVVLAWGGFTIAQFGLADVLSINGNRELAAWEVSGAPLTPEIAYLVERNINQAIEIAPRNGEYHETMGTLQWALASVAERSDEARARSLAASLEAFRTATTHARTSPYAWGNLLLTKHRAGEVDMEFDRALRNAARFGPFEPNVQAMIIEAGLWNWGRLDANQHAIVAATVDRAWETNAGSVMREALAAPGRALWCAGDGGLLKLMCERLATIPPPKPPAPQK